jgi:NAD(P)-dependent dehydrogenase (short-subunit alcohol dehydrogenase family)
MNIITDNHFQDRFFLITGASSGIGRATAEIIASRGGRLVLCGRDQNKLDNLLKNIPGKNHILNVSILDSMDNSDELLRSITSKHGQLDGIFHCAGIELIRPIKITKQIHVNQVFSSSIFAAFGIGRAVSSGMTLKEGGSLVFMSSVASISGQAGMSVYSAAKSAIDGLTRSLAAELAPKKIRVNSIISGAVKTPMHDRIISASGELATELYNKSHLLGFGDPVDVAEAAIFLLGSGSKWITGTSLVVDGGYLAK